WEERPQACIRPDSLEDLLAEGLIRPGRGLNILAQSIGSGGGRIRLVFGINPAGIAGLLRGGSQRFISSGGRTRTGRLSGFSCRGGLIFGIRFAGLGLGRAWCLSRRSGRTLA